MKIVIAHLPIVNLQKIHHMLTVEDFGIEVTWCCQTVLFVKMWQMVQEEVCSVIANIL